MLVPPPPPPQKEKQTNKQQIDLDQQACLYPTGHILWITLPLFSFWGSPPPPPNTQYAKCLEMLHTTATWRLVTRSPVLSPHQRW